MAFEVKVEVWSFKFGVLFLYQLAQEVACDANNANSTHCSCQGLLGLFCLSLELIDASQAGGELTYELSKISITS